MTINRGLWYWGRGWLGQKHANINFWTDFLETCTPRGLCNWFSKNIKANSYGSRNTLNLKKNSEHFGIFTWNDLSHILLTVEYRTGQHDRVK